MNALEICTSTLSLNSFQVTWVCVAWIDTINTSARQHEQKGRFLPVCQEAFIPSAGFTSTDSCYLRLSCLSDFLRS